MADVLCLGILVADVMARPVDEWPGRGRLVLVDKMETHIGGCAANTGSDLAILGVSTGVIGKIGHDGFGDFLIEALRANGLDTSGIRRDPHASTSSTMVMVHSDGERSFIHCIGANATLSPEMVDFDLVKQAKILHVAGAFLMPGFDGPPTAQVLRRAKELGVTTALDSAWDSQGNWMKLLRPCLEFVDYFVPSIEEARMIAEREEPRDVAQVFLDAGVKYVALKMGAEGSYVRTADTELFVPSVKVKAVDATGAGDAFVAGFLTGVVKGWDLEMTARFGNAVGASCVTAMGATDGIRNFEETLALAKNIKL